jgi:hypothetical protein
MVDRGSPIRNTLRERRASLPPGGQPLTGGGRFSRRSTNGARSLRCVGVTGGDRRGRRCDLGAGGGGGIRVGIAGGCGERRRGAGGILT